MSAKSLLAVVIVAAALVLSGCATAGGRADAGCTTALPPDGPWLDESLDSAALWHDLHAGQTTQPGTIVAMLSYDGKGALDTVLVTSSMLSAHAEDDLGAVISRHVRPAGNPGLRVAVLLGDEDGPTLRTAQYCRPEITNRDAFTAAMAAEAEELVRSGRLNRDTTVPVRVLITADGTVGNVVIDRPSSEASIDAAAHRTLYRARFTPARVDGLATPVWVNFGVGFRVR